MRNVIPVSSESNFIDVQVVLRSSKKKKNESNGLCHATRNKVVLVLKEVLGTTQPGVQSNYFVCLSNMKAMLSADILQC
jgi:hypothetical protein